MAVLQIDGWLGSSGASLGCQKVGVAAFSQLRRFCSVTRLEERSKASESGERQGASPMALTLGRGFWPLFFSYSFFELVGFRATRVNLSFEAAVGAVRKFVSHRVRERFLVTQSPS